jgi:hypothetical protein
MQGEDALMRQKSGLSALEDKRYTAAIQLFTEAIGLLPQTQVNLFYFLYLLILLCYYLLVIYFLLLLMSFCTYAFLAGLYGNIWYRLFNNLVCNLYW